MSELLPADTTDAPAVAGLLISKDLFFVSKVTGTAAALGLTVRTALDATMALAKLQAEPAGSIRCLFIDLADSRLDVAQLVAELPPDNRPALIAFGSHVDVQRLEAARQAGCDLVLPRSRFSATLPELLQQYLTP